MRRHLLLVLVVAGVAVLASLVSAATREGAAAAPRSPAGKTIKVGLVTDIGQLNDRGFNHLAYVGLLRAEKQLGVKGRVFQSAAPSDYIPNLSTLARQGYDLVIGVGYLQGDAVDTVAAKFPKTNFAIVDVDQGSLKHKPKNVLGFLYKEQEVGYLVGYLAALEEKRRPGPDVISSVGGEKQPPVDRFIAGYGAGARKASPKIRVLNGYSQDFDDQAKCKELALDQIAKGSHVVFQVAGGCGLGALDAAKEKKVWGIGVDADQSDQGPHVLTSAVKRVDSSVYLTIASVKSGTFRGGTNSVFALKQRGVALGKVSPKVPKADLAAVEKIRAQIVAGTIKNIPTQVK